MKKHFKNRNARKKTGLSREENQLWEKQESINIVIIIRQESITSDLISWKNGV